jgi:hypothetical protein
MEKMNDPWRDIALIIETDKKKALDYFHSREFAPAAAAERHSAEHLLRLPAPRPVLWAVAASLLLAVALVSLWLLRGSLRSVPAVPAGSGILADSFLYAAAGAGEPSVPEARSAGPVSSRFVAWGEAVRELAADGNEALVPAYAPDAAVEHGNPEDVRCRISRAIQENAFERLLSHWQEFHEKEA